MKNKSIKPLTFKDKTRIYSHQDDPLIRNVLGTHIDDVGIQEIINSVFKNTIQIDKQEFLLLLNNVIGFVNSFFPSITTLSPGKTDKKHLFEELEKSLSDASKNLHILLKC